MEDESLGKKKPEQESGISMLRKSFYSKEEPEELKKRTRELLTPKQPVVYPEAVDASKPSLVNVMDIKAQHRRKILIRTLLIILALSIFAGGVWLTIWYRSTQQVAQADVGLEVGAPAR